MSELAIHPLTAALQKILAKRIRFVIAADLGSIEDVRRQFTGCPETLLLALRAMQELAAWPATLAILEVMAKSIFLHGIVLGTLMKVLATLSTVTDISQKVSTNPTSGIGAISRIQSARHPDRLLMPR